MYQEKGTISFKGKVESGVSKSGANWANQTIVIEKTTYGGNKKILAFEVPGDRIDMVAGIPVGQEVTVDFYIQSREYNGRFYTKCVAMNITTGSEEEPVPSQTSVPSQPSIPSQPAAQQSTPLFNEPDFKAEEDDDLPF